MRYGSALRSRHVYRRTIGSIAASRLTHFTPRGIHGTKAELEQQEAQCNSVDDFVNLANQALNEPADTGYANTLLQKAEALSQMLIDYLTPAAIAAGRR